nr:hypothetical protein [Pseudomonas asplenii]
MENLSGIAGAPRQPSAIIPSPAPHTAFEGKQVRLKEMLQRLTALPSLPILAPVTTHS